MLKKNSNIHFQGKYRDTKYIKYRDTILRSKYRQIQGHNT